MKNITDFLDKWSVRVLLPLVLIIFFKTCSTNGKIEKTKEELTTQITTGDSTVKSVIISKDELKKMLTIEGLKVEKRMIQSTDRKILDVNRQSEIDREIQKLEGK
jgi:Mg2+/Co2+ transporter CorB